MADPERELVLTSTVTGDDGFVHVRFKQQNRGVAVFGAEWLASIDAAGRLSSMSGTYVPDLDEVKLAVLQTPEQMIAAAEADVSQRVPDLAGTGVDAQMDPVPYLYAADGVAPAFVASIWTGQGGDLERERFATTSAQTWGRASSWRGEQRRVRGWPQGTARATMRCLGSGADAQAWAHALPADAGDGGGSTLVSGSSALVCPSGTSLPDQATRPSAGKCSVAPPLSRDQRRTGIGLVLGRVGVASRLRRRSRQA